MQKAVIALGSNVSSSFEEATFLLCDALTALYESELSVEFVSNLFRTPSFPKGSGPDYANAAIRVVTDLTAPELLELLHRIEQDFGRRRDKRWAQRSLDLDLICYGDTVAPDVTEVTRWINLPLDRQMAEAPDQLILPHPRVQDRAFVLVPMAEVAPDWRHPVIERTVSEMLSALPSADVAEVMAVDLPESACKSDNRALCQWLPRTTSL